MSTEKFNEGMKTIFEMDVIPEDTILKEAIDSLSMAEIIIYAEDELGVQLNNEQILGLKTYGDLLCVVGLK